MRNRLAESHKCYSVMDEHSINIGTASTLDQIVDLIYGVYFKNICDLNLLKTLPLPPPPHLSFLFFFLLAFSCLNAPLNTEIRHSNKHFHALDIAWLSI